LPLALTRGEGRQIAERWLSEARVARDRLRFALPPSRYDLGAGDVVSLDGTRFRIDRMEQGPLQIAEAVRIEPSIYTPGAVIEDAPSVRPFVPPMPVTPLFLDLPLMRGDETPHAPHIAATAATWPGAVSVYQSATDSNYALNSVLTNRATVGLLQSALPDARAAVWVDGQDIHVRLISGQLESAEETAVLAGSNLAAIGDGTPGNWELIQFANAELTAPQTYRLSRLLRGQQGTDALMPDIWPAESWFVLLNGIPSQIDLSANLRQIVQHFRIGPARRAIDDPSFRHVEAAFDGNGLRPFAPAHLSVNLDDTGALALSWIRRTRVEGDSWEGEVPLGEDAELYRIQIAKDGTPLREVETTTPDWLYPAALQAVDTASGDIDVRVSQVSARYGAGPAAVARVTL
jgi:hypothetical protein